MSICLTSILTLYNVVKQEGGDLFNGVLFPDTFTKPLFVKQYTRDVFERAILWNCAELELLFNDPTTLNAAMVLWSQQQYPIWAQLVETMEYEYDPIENYNRTEYWTQRGGHETHDLTVTDRNGNATNESTMNGSQNQADKRNQSTVLDGTIKTDNTTTTDFDRTLTPNLTDTRSPNLTDKRSPNLTDTRTPALEDQTVNSRNSFNLRTGSGDSLGVNPPNPPISQYPQLWPTEGSRTTREGNETTKRTGDETETHTGNETTTHTGNEKVAEDTTVTLDGTQKTDDTTTFTANDTFDSTSQASGNSTDTQSEQSGNKTDGERYYEDRWDGNARGNIGVTTTQQLIESQREVIQLDIVQVVVDSFMRNLTLEVW